MSRPSLMAGALVLAVSCTSSIASGQTVTANASSPQPGTTVITVTVTPGSGETMKDFHFRPPKNMKLKAATGDDAPSGWSVSPANDGIDVTTTGGGITNDGNAQNGTESLTFTLTYTHSTSSGVGGLDWVFWAITNDGDKKIGPQDTKPGPTKTKPEDTLHWGGPGMPGSLPGLPLNSITFRSATNLQVAIGNDVPLPLETTAADHVYTVHTSIALSSSDPDELGIDLEQPLPESWGITVAPVRGTFDRDSADDLLATPVIRIPNDEGLIGLVFYATVSLDVDGNGRPDVRTPVRRFTIQSQGSGASGIEDLPVAE